MNEHGLKLDQRFGVGCANRYSLSSVVQPVRIEMDVTNKFYMMYDELDNPCMSAFVMLLEGHLEVVVK